MVPRIWWTTVPVVPDPETARAAARDELTDPAYRSQEPTLFERVTDKIVERLGDLFSRTADSAPGGRWSLVLLTALVLLGLWALRARLGKLAGTGRRTAEVFGEAERTAAEHHADADAALAAGNLDTAVTERFRALVRGLEERGLFEPRPGRTAHEAGEEGGRLLPACALSLRAAARVFDEVRYGGRAATRAGHDTVAEADRAARAARPETRTDTAADWVAPGAAP
ncbi:MAG TPA: DUF4129 domain-containing protein [Sporichthya sp.]|nr:DUF4129 domain-containing protein [Sporichthya sp.]